FEWLIDPMALDHDELEGRAVARYDDTIVLVPGPSHPALGQIDRVKIGGGAVRAAGRHPRGRDTPGGQEHNGEKQRDRRAGQRGHWRMYPSMYARSAAAGASARYDCSDFFAWQVSPRFNWIRPTPL